MSEEDKSRRRRKRGAAAAKLRRYMNLENVMIEEPFSLSMPAETPAGIKSELGLKPDGPNQVGDAYYVSSTVGNNHRYYGVLVDQTALKAASLLHFQDEARSINFTRRIKALKERLKPAKGENDTGGTDAGSRGRCEESTASLETDDDHPKKKRKVEKIDPTPPRQVQKFRYVDHVEAKDPTGLGYRILLATFADVAAAAEDDPILRERIESVCEAGGHFVGKYYYQYEELQSTLKYQYDKAKRSSSGIRTSVGFDSFLLQTALPTWYPLSNLQISQHKILSMLQMKKGNKGTVEYDTAKQLGNVLNSSAPSQRMKPRTRYRVAIVGGGIAGLSCARQLLLQSEDMNLQIEVIILEARSRLGGRLMTDRSCFKFKNGEAFPLDLGASWIHGIDQNPLASLAKESGIDFVTASEEVKMLRSNLESVDSKVDERMGKLLDEILDEAANDIWDYPDFVPDGARNQNAVRWYASDFGKIEKEQKNSSCSKLKTDAPPHRWSSDVSIDHALGRAIAKHKHKEFGTFGEEEHNLLLWNVFNLNYALGANLCDLSMKFWDSDERHAFEGDHVMLRQGYSTIVDHLQSELMNRGDRFKIELDYVVDKIEYARNTSSLPYSNTQKLVELSDKCCISSSNGKESYVCDFVVCTLPLGVLKASIAEVPDKSKVTFEPPLPFPKVDAIQSVGFGLLNKVCLQFPEAFWRLPSLFEDGQILFGNSSGLYPHYYMFFDMGLSLSRGKDAPPILMTLISGKEAVESEQKEDTEVVGEVLATLRKLFAPTVVPDPSAHRVTRWGTDRFSRGCYTFLPPGATDQDFHVLQSPVNGNGDSLELEGSGETMRLFFAGEHCTALHPSMAHGAMLSGLRAAKEVISSLDFSYNDERVGYDRMIPLSLFRKRNPTDNLACSMCHQLGSTVREGSLLAFQKGARQVLVHNNCGENSPEVEVRDGRWRNVVRAVNRGKQINCCMCGKVGASIGCTYDNCFRSFHFGCAYETGWRFERDGKTYFCDQHRKYENLGDNECDQISIVFFETKAPAGVKLRCSFCGAIGDDERMGKILAFQQKEERMLVHDKCARYTNVMETLDDPRTLSDTDFRNLFLIRKQMKCAKCSRMGATVACCDPSCDRHFHVLCAEDSNWDFAKRGLSYRCATHREMGRKSGGSSSQVVGSVHHALFSLDFNNKGNEALRLSSYDTAVNTQMGASLLSPWRARPETDDLNSIQSDISSNEEEEEIDHMSLVMERPDLTGLNGTTEIMELRRASLSESWNFSFILHGKDNGGTKLSIEFLDEEVKGKDDDTMVLGIDGKKVGTDEFKTLQDAMVLLRSGTILNVEIFRDHPIEGSVANRADMQPLNSDTLEVGGPNKDSSKMGNGEYLAKEDKSFH